MKMKLSTALAIGILLGVIIGSAIGYGYSLSTQKPKSWHEVTSFILAATNQPVSPYYQIAYSYPNIYYTNGPLFNIKEDFWRAKVQTIPYYNYSNGEDTMIIYYNQAPINNIRIWKDQAYVDNPFSSIVMLDPTYDYNVTTSGTAQALDQYFYVSWKEQYMPVETVPTFAGKGNYIVSLDTGIACFNFTIEEYR